MNAFIYQVSSNTTRDKITKTFFINAQKNIVVTYPYKASEQYLLSEGEKKEDNYIFTITRLDEPLITYKIFIPINIGRYPILEYQHQSIVPTKCFSIIRNDTIDLFKNHTDSCYYIQRLEPPLNTFVIEYSDQNNPSNKLIIKDTEEVNNNGIDVQFPNSIIGYIPERNFGIVCLSNQGLDTFVAYFSLHSNHSWFIDSVADYHFQKSKYLHQRLNPNQTNYFQGID